MTIMTLPPARPPDQGAAGAPSAGVHDRGADRGRWLDGRRPAPPRAPSGSDLPGRKRSKFIRSEASCVAWRGVVKAVRDVSPVI